jgi:hypothetical protein
MSVVALLIDFGSTFTRITAVENHGHYANLTTKKE